MSIQAVAWVLRHSEARLGARLVLLSIANYADEDGGNSWPAVATIAKDARMSQRQVQRAVQTLEASGEIAIERGGGDHKHTHRYVILGMRSPELTGDNMSSVEQGTGDKSGKQRVTNQAGTGDKMSPNPLDEPLENPPPLPPRKRRDRSLSQSEEDEFEAWWETYPHKVGKAAARSAWRSARGKAGLDDLLAGVVRYVAAKPPDRAWANPATWLNQERWADQPAGTTPPLRTAAEREASNVLTFEELYDRRQAGMLARVERWIAGEEWDDRDSDWNKRPDKGLINLPDRLLEPLRAGIERRGAECQAADNRKLWDENKAWVRKKAAAHEDPAPQVFDRLRDDATAQKQFGCTREGLRQFIVETCAKVGLATAAEGMSFSPPAQQQGAAR